MADETLSLSDDDDFDGLKIRPPQPSSSRPRDPRGGGSRVSRDRRGGRDRRDDSAHHARGGGGRDRQRGAGPPPQGPGRRDDRSLGQNRHPIDLRNRLGRKEDHGGRHPPPRDLRDPRGDARIDPRGDGRGDPRGDPRHFRGGHDHKRRRQLGLGHAPGESEEERLKREDRLRKFMTAESEKERSRRDIEVRKQRKQVEREMSEYEDRMKRKRDRSAEGAKSKRSREETTESKEDDDEESEENEEESEDGESGDEEEEEEEEDDEEDSEEEESDTASEQSGATPDHVSDKEEEELEAEKEIVLEIEDEDEELHKRRHRKKKSHHHHHRKGQEEEEDTEGRWRDKKSDHSVHDDHDRTPIRSPMPLREEATHNEHEDEEDSRLEAALRGEFKDRLTETAEGTPKSQSSFGDGISAEREEEASRDSSKALAAQLEEQKNKLPPYLPSIYGCRSVEEFHCMNRIEEGTYGVVYRARDKKTNEIVALKRLKMEREKEGFPITSLREINTLLISQHINVVTVREIVVGSNMDKIYIVMDFVQHDLKTLMESMREKKKAFSIGEIKCLMDQLLKAIAHLHDNWILHRDLKTSNLLLGHDGTLKVGDFGLAREYGSPLKPYTPIVVTLWYRAPELLLGQREYSTHIDLWSIGCIFAELLQMQPLFCGKSEQDQLNKIFKVLGTPSEKIWPGYAKLPLTQKIKFVNYPISHLRKQIPFPTEEFTAEGFRFLQSFLTYDPKQRMTCAGCIQVSERTGQQETVGLAREYFSQYPKIIGRDCFSSWPAKSELSDAERVGGAKKVASPKPPSGGGDYKKINDEDDVIPRTSGAGGGFDFVARNSTSNLAEWKLKF